MKYFTPELLERLNSGDLADVADAMESWDKSAEQYAQRVSQIQSPALVDVAELMATHRFHDAQVLNLSYQEGDKLSLVLRQDDALHVLTFVLVAAPTLIQPAKSPTFASAGLLWLYEEVDLDRGVPLLRVLLSDGSELTIPLSSVSVQSFDVRRRPTKTKTKSTAKGRGDSAKSRIAGQEPSALDHLMPVIPPLDRRADDVRFALIVKTSAKRNGSGNRSTAAKVR